jgi:signal transduction histidine kinase
MLMPASTEFVDLCRSQLALIAEGLGAASCAVYLAEEFADVSRRNLIPIAFYPEPAYASPEPPALSRSKHQTPPAMQVLPAVSPGRPDPLGAKAELTPLNSPVPAQDGLVIPLLHNNLVFGILVARRADRDWTPREQEQLTEVSHTLALACVLDQRHQWLQQSDYEQRSFLNRQYDTLANLLHQIRNPLTTVRTLAKLLFKRQATGSKEQELVSSILQESEHLQQLLQQFDQTIDVGEALLEQGSGASPTQPRAAFSLPAATSAVGTQLSLQPLQLRDLLHPLLVANQALAAENQQTLSAALADATAEHWPPVLADAQAMREVLGNLLDNALKYTPPGGQIHVSLHRVSQHPHQSQPSSTSGSPDNSSQKDSNPVDGYPVEHYQVICISDTGPGIPASDLPQLGQRHYRGVQAGGAIPGTGLGLSIVRELLTLMQGSLEVKSPALWQPPSPRLEGSPASDFSSGSTFGPGSSFLLTLPECLSTIPLTTPLKE